MEEEKNQTELCAIPKEVAIEKINKLVEQNKEVFDEYFLWVKVIQSQVTLVNKTEKTIEE